MAADQRKPNPISPELLAIIEATEDQRRQADLAAREEAAAYQRHYMGLLHEAVTLYIDPPLIPYLRFPGDTAFPRYLDSKHATWVEVRIAETAPIVVIFHLEKDYSTGPQGQDLTTERWVPTYYDGTGKQKYRVLGTAYPSLGEALIAARQKYNPTLHDDDDRDD